MWLKQYFLGAFLLMPMFIYEWIWQETIEKQNRWIEPSKKKKNKTNCATNTRASRFPAHTVSSFGAVIFYFIFLSTLWILCIFVSPAHLRRRFDCSTHRSVTSTLAKINQAQIKATWCLYGTLCISKVVQLRFIQLRRFSTRNTKKKKIKTNKNPNEAHAR